MNRMRAGVLALCTLTVGTLPVMAQNAGAPPPPAQGPDQAQGPMGPHGRMSPEQREARQLEHLTKHLQLTPDQVAQVKAIDDAQHAQMLALRDDTSTPREDKHAKMMAMHEQMQTQIRGVLTDQQKPKYDEMIAREKEHMQHGRGGQEGPPPPPPPAQ